MDVAMSWPAALTLLSGVVLLVQIPCIRRNRDDLPEPTVLVALVSTTSLWALSYGVALTVFDPGLRRLMEIPVWFFQSLLAVVILVGGLKYTGHDDIVPNWFIWLFVASSFGSWLLHTGNALGHHELMWTAYQVEPVLGAAAAVYEPTVSMLISISAAYLVFTVFLLGVLAPALHYGWLSTLYSGHFLVVVLAPLPPALAHVVWFLGQWPTLDVNPFPGLDLTPAAFLLSGAMLLWMVSLETEKVTEVTPGDRRRADLAILKDLDTGVVAADSDGLVTRMNSRAGEILEVDPHEAFSSDVDSLLDVDVDLPVSRPEVVRFPGKPGRTFELRSSPIVDDGGSTGYILTLQDITRQRHRRQRLEVLNRVLRHNVRNDMTVVKGSAEYLRKQVLEAEDVEVDDAVEEAVKEKTSTIVDAAEDLEATSEKARSMADSLPGGSPNQEEFDVPRLTREVVMEVESEYGSTDLEVDASGSHPISNDPDLVELAVYNVLENAVVHSTSDEAEVVVRCTADGSYGGVKLEVEDDGPGIPMHEVDAVESGEETALSHGSGLGLWLVKWCVDELGGELKYEVEDGTRVTLYIPDRNS